MNAMVFSCEDKENTSPQHVRWRMEFNTWDEEWNLRFRAQRIVKIELLEQ